MKTLAIAAICLIMSVVTSVSYAQMQPQGTPSAAAPSSMGPMGAGPGGGMGGMGGMGDMMSMMMTMHPAIAVDADTIYIVRGDQVLKLRKSDLQVIGTGTLPPAPTPAMSGAGGGMGMSGGGMSGGGMMGQGPAAAVRPETDQMMQQMRQMQPSQFEQSFLDNMIRHHQGAIEMSRLALTKSIRPQLRRFAESVITNQTSEQQRFGAWLKNWYKASAIRQPRPIDDQMMNQLRNLNGREFEIQYMRDMIIHHSEAVSMARDAEQKAVHPEVKTAAANIIKKQSAEINELQRWLSTWYGVR